MSIARKAAVACAGALVAAALAAPTASAQEGPIEVIHAGTGNHCDPCSFHITGGHTVRVFGVAVSICTQDEFEGEIYESQELGLQGHINTYENDHGVIATCNVINCNGVGEAASESEWDIGPVGETGPNAGHMSVGMCLDREANPNAAGIHCDVEVNFQPGMNHRYRFTSNYLCANMVQIEGTWELETQLATHDDIEFVHI
jgi:hypothetical protein